MIEQPTPSDHNARSDARLLYIPGLDGLRAISVIAVLLYHAQLPVWGGFGGVETFFVISGFLITALLLAEWRDHDSIDLVRFWQRRARRLLPPLFVMLAGTLGLAFLVGGSEPRKVLHDLPAAIGYVMNWHLIWSGQSYFEPMARPPLLQHVWSLAVEEQFYLVWPVVFVAGMRFLRARGFLLVTLALAVGSAVLMALWYRPGLDPSRIYYGTDTRAAGVLFGAVLAFVWTPGRAPLPANPRLGWLADGAGLMALAGLVVCFGWMSDLHPLLYRGGFALIAALTGVTIGALLHPSARVVPALLGAAPLRWIGLRSYGLYLWHWPVFMVTRPFLDVPFDGAWWLVVRLAIVGVLVELSYRWVELPARSGAIGRWWQRVWGEREPAVALASAARPARMLFMVVPILVFAGFGLRMSQGSAAADNTPAAAQSSQGDAAPAPVQQPATGSDALAPVPPTATSEAAASPVEAGQATELAAEPTTAAAGGAMVDQGDASGVLEDVRGRATPRTANGATQSTPPPTVTATPAAPTPTMPPTPTAGPPQPIDPALVAELQALLDDSVADGTIPGATIAIHIPGYEPWTGSSGTADRRRGLAMEPDTLIHIGSITKMFTAVVVLQLVQEGVIGLDDPVGTYLPGVIPFDQSTTVRHLLSHRSGLFDYLEDSRFFVQAYRNPTRTWTPEEIVDMVDDFGAEFRPGTPGAWKYASTNYVILAMLVEQATGRSLAQEMRARIFDPVGMTHTYFSPDEEPPTRVAQGYIDFSDRSNLHMTFVYGTGNVISTADDLRLFANALWGGKLLDQPMWREMSTLTPTGGAYDMPELLYGLGMMGARLNVAPNADGERRSDERSTVEGHIGGIAGSRAVLWRVPATGVLITLTMNQSDIDPNILARDTLDVILAWQER
jgi:peptidoglycan/LPS O-acetylase OafA/YrhL/CubicO group peptidase (beta-lactamase class C family)